MEPNTKKTLIVTLSSLAGIAIIYFSVKAIKNHKVALANAVIPGVNDPARQALDALPVDTSNISAVYFPLVTGSRGKAVVLLQLAMNNKYGFNVTVDGRMGEEMKMALMAFQATDAAKGTTLFANTFWSLLSNAERAVSVDKHSWDLMTSGVDYQSIFNVNPQYKDIYNQYTA